MSWREEFDRIVQGRTFCFRLDDPVSFVTLVKTISFDMYEAGQKSKLNLALASDCYNAGWQHRDKKIETLESEKAALEKDNRALEHILTLWRKDQYPKPDSDLPVVEVDRLLDVVSEGFGHYGICCADNEKITDALKKHKQIKLVLKKD